MATPPKELSEHQVLALFDRIVTALRAEGYDSFFAFDSEQMALAPAEAGTVVGVLLSIWERARSARARVFRDRRRADHQAKGTMDYQVYNDASRDNARGALRAAQSHLQVAHQALAEHGANVEKECFSAPIAEPRERWMARVTAEALGAVGELLAELQLLEGHITTREWEDLVSDFAIELHAVGVPDARIAEILLDSHYEDAAEAIGQRRRRRTAASDPTPRAPAP